MKNSLLHRLLRAAAAAVAAATLATVLAGSFWIFELVTHFRLQMIVGASLLAVVAGVCRLPVVTGVLVVAAGWHAVVVSDYLLPGGGGGFEPSAGIRLLSVNVSRRNTDYSALRELVEETSPDVIVLIEVDPAWLESLQRFDGRYPHRIARPEDGFYGLAVLSRFPLRERPESPLFHDGVQTALLADLEIGGEPVFLAAVHLRAPTSPGLARARNEQIRMLAGIFRDAQGTPRLLVGDLNVTPWSPWYDLLESDTGIANAGLGRGYVRTWPTRAALLGIPIDHCLVSAELRVIEAAALRDIGSDHLPLLVEMALSTDRPR